MVHCVQSVLNREMMVVYDDGPQVAALCVEEMCI